MWASLAVLGLLAVAVLVPLAGLLIEVPVGNEQGLHIWKDAYLRQVTMFSLIQAMWSTVLASLGLLVARSMFYSPNFPGRKICLVVWITAGRSWIVAVRIVLSMVAGKVSGRNLYGLQGT